MKLHRGKGCEFCGKVARHQPRVRRTNPGGQLAVIVDCNIPSGRYYTWTASGPSRDGKQPNGVDIRARIRLGVFLPVEAS